MTISADSSSPLISAEALKAALGRVRVFDVRFDLARPEAGEAAWREGHLPGAHYLHLDRDLSGVKVTGVVNDNRPSRMVYEPGHPDADAEGYVAYPDINVVEEMANLITTMRGYEANATSISTVKTMFYKALEIGK